MIFHLNYNKYLIILRSFGLFLLFKFFLYNESLALLFSAIAIV